MDSSVHSICGLDENEWKILLYTIPQGIKIELNLSCPNVEATSISDTLLKQFIDKFPMLSVKVRYDISDFVAKKLHSAGVKSLHCSNTIPTERGGLSGTPLQKLNIPAIKRLSSYGFDSLIAGGGIYSARDVDEYREAGATDFSISTVYISCPWNIPAIYEAVTK